MAEPDTLSFMLILKILVVIKNCLRCIQSIFCKYLIRLHNLWWFFSFHTIHACFIVFLRINAHFICVINEIIITIITVLLLLLLLLPHRHHYRGQGKEFSFWRVVQVLWGNSVKIASSNCLLIEPRSFLSIGLSRQERDRAPLYPSSDWSFP